MGRLEGKVAIITGAARGMGAETARQFAAQGARVCVTDVLDTTPVAEEIGTAAMAMNHDVTDESRWQAVTAEVARRFGQIDILVNNAGIVFWGGSILEIEKADFDRLYNVNLLGAWLGIKHVAPSMIRSGGGSIVNICSISGMTGLNGIAPYAASKWALRGLSKTAAMELGPKKIRVNAVFPGTINTEMGNVAKESTEALNARQKGLPIARIGEPIDIAQASLFLASDESAYMTGAEIVVDGGLTTGFYSSALPGGIE
ncbi:MULTISPECIES: SDR family NAD(P)-dependent oxidoreductase [Sphingobium]|uniref:SDR family NAD(P)-dependent oxidoreductase n=1 Tax=Sphingobium sp. MI1205 TaxID=407020 RepID=UPI0007704DDD|nr:glucose 1-dehydrogenase [Sphingobium sp. MI1205]AMK19908.1 short-chain dehydrogenase/reductase SDR [Sphingobium sp. MI1205]